MLWVIAGAAGAVALVTGPLQIRIFKPIRAHGGAGIVGFELAGSWTRARAIMAAWGEPGCTAMRRSLVADFFFLAGYGTLGATLAYLTACHAHHRGWPGWAHLAIGAMVAFIVAAALDAVENIALFVVLRDSGSGPSPAIAAYAARAKFALLLLAVIVTVGVAVLFLAPDAMARHH